jgi:hypothetical protein
MRGAVDHDRAAASKGWCLCETLSCDHGEEKDIFWEAAEWSHRRMGRPQVQPRTDRVVTGIEQDH